MRIRLQLSRWWHEAGIAALVLIASVCAADALDRERLADLVRQDCGSCHGLTLKGGLGKPLTPENLQGWDREQIAHIILDGVPGTPMPPWRPLLTQAEAEWIADALKQGTIR